MKCNNRLRGVGTSVIIFRLLHANANALTGERKRGERKRGNGDGGCRPTVTPTAPLLHHCDTFVFGSRTVGNNCFLLLGLSWAVFG